MTDTATDRGQLLLAGAVGFAVLLIVLALILNAAMFSEAIASRSGSSQDERAAVSYHDATNRQVEELIDRVNANHRSSYAAVYTNLSESIAAWSALSAHHAALEGASTNTTLVSVTNGTYIVHENTSRPFTNRSNATTWSPAASVTRVRGYRMYVPADTLYELPNETCTPADDCFTVRVDNGSAVWRAHVYSPNDSAGINVSIEDASGDTYECHTSNTSAWINLTAGIVDGDRCAPLAFPEDLAGSYTLTYANADMVRGRYELLVDTRLTAAPHFSEHEAPRIAPSIYDARVSITYRSETLVYSTDARVVPANDEA